MPMDPSQLSDREIADQLATPAELRGPRTFRDRPLGKYSLNASGLVAKVLGLEGACAVADALVELRSYPTLAAIIEPRLIEHDFLLLELLADVYCEDDAHKAAAYRRILTTTDDAAGYRARVALRIETASDADRAEARRLVQEILTEVEDAKITVEKKRDCAASPTPAPMTTPSSSGTSRRKPRGRKNTSAGS